MNPMSPGAAPAIVFAHHTEIGRRREHNEDFPLCAALGDGALLIVSDGVGGAKAGEVASKMVATGILQVIQSRLARETPPADRQPWLDEAARELDRNVRELAEQPGLSGMGATLSALWLDGGRAWWVQAGDSRIYLLRGGELRQISRDQSPVGRLRAEGQISEEEARKHPYRHMIDQCLGGGGATVVPVTGEIEIQPRDVFLLCSDGLSDGLWDRDIAEGLKSAVEGMSPAETAKLLVTRANDASGNDNITAAVGRVERIQSPVVPLPAAAPAVARSWAQRMFRRLSGGGESITSPKG